MILLVDDERPLREILAQALEDSGYRVRQAFHGRHALELIAEQPPDLVIADVMMPLVGGVELCQTLKARPETPAIPVILMSAAAPYAGRGAGADALVGKPFDLDAMDLPDVGRPIALELRPEAISLILGAAEGETAMSPSSRSR